jgi:hypothetical protein
MEGPALTENIVTESTRDVVLHWADGRREAISIVPGAESVNQLDAQGVYHVFDNSGDSDDQGRQIWIEKQDAPPQAFAAGR